MIHETAWTDGIDVVARVWKTDAAAWSWWVKTPGPWVVVSGVERKRNAAIAAVQQTLTRQGWIPRPRGLVVKPIKRCKP